MVNLVDYEAVNDGENFTFIKALRDDGTIDPRIGKSGPYEITGLTYPYEINISHIEGLTQKLIEKMIKQFIEKH